MKSEICGDGGCLAPKYIKKNERKAWENFKKKHLGMCLLSQSQRIIKMFFEKILGKLSV